MDGQKCYFWFAKLASYFGLSQHENAVMNPDIYERIEDYLLGRLSPEAKKAFELSMKEDEALAAAVDLQKQLIEASSETEILQLRQQLRSQFEHTKGGVSSRPWILAIISLLVVLALLFYLVPRTQSDLAPIPTEEQTPITTPSINPDGDSEFLELQSEELKEPIAGEEGKQPSLPENTPEQEQTAPPVQNDSRYLAMANDLYEDQAYSVTTIRSETDVAVTDLEKAADAFRDTSYQQVIDLLENSTEAASSEALKLQAHALFRLGRYKESALLFESLRGGFYRYDADWFQLLCYLANLPATQSDFDAKRAAILDGDNHPFAEKVRAIEIR